MPRRPDMPPLDRGDLDLDPIAQFQRLVRARAARGRRCRGDDPGDRRRRRGARRAHGAAQGRRRARLSLLHQPRLGQGDAARRVAARGAGRLLARARPPGARARAGRARSPTRSPTPTSPPGPATRSSAPGPRRSRGRSPRRTELDQHLDEVEARFADGEVPRPPHWGGYLVVPEEVEFWQGRIGRLHDRFRYTRERSELADRAPGAVGARASGPRAGRRSSSSSSRLSKRSSARTPWRAARTLTPVPSARSSASSARSSAAC